jgi:hypothetical protein
MLYPLEKIWKEENIPEEWEEAGAIEKTALDWNPQGYRRRGRSKRTWRRTIEDEIRGPRRSWNEVNGIAGDRINWKLFMAALCCTRSKRTWWWLWVHQLLLDLKGDCDSVSGRSLLQYCDWVWYPYEMKCVWTLPTAESGWANFVWQFSCEGCFETKSCFNAIAFRLWFIMEYAIMRVQVKHDGLELSGT